MKWIIVGLIALGVIAAFSASVLTAGLRTRATTEVVDDSQSSDIEVLVAAHDLSAMTVVVATSAVRKSVPVNEVPDGAMSSTVQLIGQILMVAMLEGQPFLKTNLASQNPGLHLAATLPEGGRAMSIILSEDTSLAGLLYPGCLVDVVASFRVPAGPGVAAGEILSTTILQGVRVLAVGDRSVVAGNTEINVTESQVRKTHQIVTLLLDSKQAEALQLAAGHARVSLVLRNPLDTVVTIGHGVALSQLSAEFARRLAPLAGELVLSGPVMEVGKAASTPGPEILVAAQPYPALANAAVAEAPMWTTVVLHGGTVEVLNFPQVEPSETGMSGLEPTSRDGASR